MNTQERILQNLSIELGDNVDRGQAVTLWRIANRFSKDYPHLTYKILGITILAIDCLNITRTDKLRRESIYNSW